MQQLNYKPLLGGHPGTFTLETLQKFKDNTTGTLLAESFPYPSLSNVKTFPALKQFFADMKASKQKILDPKNIQPTSLYPWVSTLAFVNALKDTDTVTKDSVIQALRTGQDIDLMGLAEPWTPSAPGFSVFAGISNPYVYVSKFDGKNVVTEKQSIDVSQYFK
jgi:ABC-type branched-subunit amino acid transport system substrate-binding protein